MKSRSNPEKSVVSMVSKKDGNLFYAVENDEGVTNCENAAISLFFIQLVHSIENTMVVTKRRASNPTLSAINSFQDIQRHPRVERNPVKIHGFRLLASEQMPTKPALLAGTFVGIVLSACGYISRRGHAMKLSDTQIKRIKPTTKPRKVSDGGGLFLWITPSGGRLWRWAYSYQGLAKLMTFGKYPDVTLECILSG